MSVPVSYTTILALFSQLPLLGLGTQASDEVEFHPLAVLWLGSCSLLEYVAGVSQGAVRARHVILAQARMVVGDRTTRNI